ncbi:SMP-30/gluconolactonase/LRE family protein [Hoeflea sp. AS60]|uniref:SMP-30/gluconolactonase/LRE family protein n=1 Tax=Hoeflea sp. AS60 TaxID=3135780 RepID=UPI003177A90F
MTKIARNVTARRISPTADMLGESPVWDPQNATLYWVDGVSRLIRVHDTLAGTFSQIEVPSTIGSIGLGQDGKLVAGLVDGIYLVDIASGDCTPLYKLPKASDRIRFNDGKVDRQGRFLCGSMGVFAESCGELIRVDSNGKADVLANGIRISNSLCFSPDGSTMYFSDSLDRKVRAYSYDKDDGTLDRPRIHVDTAEFDSGPDGATVDSEGCIWVALVQAGKIGRFTPDGKLDCLVEAPTDMPTCMTFGGPDLSTLFVTSIKDSGSGRAVSRHPHGGALYALEGLGVTGLPEPRFGQTQGLPS